jgi:allantoin racemase
MTVLYQIPGDMTAGPLGAAEIARRRDILQEWAAPGTVVDAADAPGGPLSIESHAEELLCVPPMIRALQERRQRPDAIIVGCFGDPGLAALRELFDCPIVGPFEASIHLGAQLGARVGVVTVLDSVVPMLDHLARGMGMSLRYAGATAIDVPVLEVKRDPALVVERVANAGLDLVRQHSADVLVVGCMSLAFLGVAEQVAPRVGVPVVNPAKCALKTAEALVAQGLAASRRTYAKPRKPILTMEETR